MHLTFRSQLYCGPNTSSEASWKNGCMGDNTQQLYIAYLRHKPLRTLDIGCYEICQWNLSIITLPPFRLIFSSNGTLPNNTLGKNKREPHVEPYTMLSIIFGVLKQKFVLISEKYNEQNDQLLKNFCIVNQCSSRVHTTGHDNHMNTTGFASGYRP